MSEPIQLEIAGKVAVMTIDRPDRRNALDHLAMAALAKALRQADEAGVAALIITGAGGRSFCAGDDVKAYAERTKEESRAHFERGLRTFDAIEGYPGLVIAAIEGFALGGGLELALCCDLRFASRSSQFGLPEVPKLNALPSWGGLTRLPRVVGLGRAKELVLTGERIDAEAALRIGLIARLCDDGTVLEEARAFADAFVETTDRATVEVAKQVLLSATTAPPTTASLINLLAERSQAFEGA